MLFSSIIFVFYFLPITLILYFIIPKKWMVARNVLLLLASLFFYSWGEPVYVMLMIYSILFNYFMAKQIHMSQQNGGSGKLNLVFTIVINIFVLGFFKYFGFLMDTINALANTNIKYTALALPIGISFYTFQAMSYIIDVYRRRVEPQKKLLSFALYLSLFPQLIAGPIVRYRDVQEQILQRETDFVKFGEGVTRFIFGLAKKVILANNLGALYQAVLGFGDDRISVLSYWLGILAYTLQIYFDFSGYSDMAIGLGKMFGFDFIENFNYPYVAKSVTEFWRRWHMSLSSWFREYVYIPMGGNRCSVMRHIFNLLVVWALTGLWHGASWNFVTWGLYYCILLILEKYVYGELLEKSSHWVRHLYLMLVVMIGWTIFSITDLNEVGRYIGIMFGCGKYPLANMMTAYLIRTNFALLVMSVVACAPRAIRVFNALSRKRPIMALIAIVSIFIISVSYLVYGSYNPFLYFRF